MTEHLRPCGWFRFPAKVEGWIKRPQYSLQSVRQINDWCASFHTLPPDNSTFLSMFRSSRFCRTCIIQGYNIYFQIGFRRIALCKQAAFRGSTIFAVRLGLPAFRTAKGTALNRIKQHFFKKIWKEVLFVLENYPYLLDFKQVQEILRIGRNQLLFRLQSGEIPAFKVGRKWRVRKMSCCAIWKKANRQCLTNDITFDTMELKINVILIGGTL